LLLYLKILDPDDCCPWIGFFPINIASRRVRGHFFSNVKKILYEARDYVAGFAPKVVEMGSEIPLIVSLERDAMVPGLENVCGLHLDISCASGEGSSTNLRYLHVQCPLDGLSEGFRRRIKQDGGGLCSAYAQYGPNNEENAPV